MSYNIQFNSLFDSPTNSSIALHTSHLIWQSAGLVICRHSLSIAHNE